MLMSFSPVKIAMRFTGFTLIDNSQDIRFRNDVILDVVDLHLVESVFREHDDIAHFDVDRQDIAALVALTFADGDDDAALRLLFACGIRNDDARRRALVHSLFRLHHDAVRQRAYLKSGLRGGLRGDANLLRNF